MSRKHQREELDSAALAARQVLATDNASEMERVMVMLKQAWYEAGELDGDIASQVIGELERRIEAIKQRPLAQALRACTVCHCATIWLSNERTIEGLGRVRIAQCDGCGAITTFSTVRLRPGMGFQPVTVPDSTGPFR